MFTLYLALPNRETILNVLSLLFYIGSASFIPHLQSQGTARETPNPFVCSQSSSSQVRFDSSVIERDIYLYSPHCTRQIKWVCVCTHGAKQMVIRRDLWLTGTMNEDKRVPVSLPRRRGTFHTSVERFITSIETFLGHTGKMQVQGRNPVRQIIQIWAWQNIIM